MLHYRHDMLFLKNILHMMRYSNPKTVIFRRSASAKTDFLSKIIVLPLSKAAHRMLEACIFCKVRNPNTGTSKRKSCVAFAAFTNPIPSLQIDAARTINASVPPKPSTSNVVQLRTTTLCPISSAAIPRHIRIPCCNVSGATEK